MLQFLKKTGQKKHSNSISIDNSTCEITIEAFAEKFLSDNADETTESPRSTRLSRNMLDILNDKGVLCFFVQFMETKSALSFIKFWLDVESFRTVSGEKKLAKLNKPLKNKIQTLPSANSMVSSQSTNSLFDQEVSITSLGAGSDIGSRKLHRSISSDCYEGYYTTEFDCMSVSTNSYSEHNFDELEEDQKETSPDEADHSCTATEANDVLPETPEKLETSEKTAICDTENLDVRQSLTDDEKSKINDKIRQQDEDYQAQKKPQSTALADAVRIYRKYLITNSQHFIELPATILSKLSVALCGDDAGVTCSSFIYEEAQKHIYDIFERDFLYDFLDSSFYTKYTVEVLTSANLKLAEILSSESALFYFMEFLEQDTKRCYLEFWLSATNFRKQIEQSDMVDQQQVQSDALIIYEKYFSLQATNPLNLPKNVRLQVEEHICSLKEDQAKMSTCFDQSLKITEAFLEHSYLSKFMKSQLFFKYLSELMHKIQSSKEIDKKQTNLPLANRHRKTFSDCTSDKAKAAINGRCQNTLLAMESKPRNSDMQIDSRQIYNPDLLWRRKNSLNGLSFGRVDEFGRFERDFEVSPVSSFPNRSLGDEQKSQSKWNHTQSKIKNAVRKLVNLPEDKVQEEIAWQVAEMIVKDVTNITLNPDT